MNRLQLKVSAERSLDVLLGNGVTVKAWGICRSVMFYFDKTDFTSDFISLELGSVDVILGVEWLETLGKCEVVWKNQELSFTYCGSQVTLFGDPTLHCPKLSHKSLVSSGIGSEQGREEPLLINTNTLTRPDMSSHLNKLFQKFEDVFAIPT